LLKRRKPFTITEDWHSRFPFAAGKGSTVYVEEVKQGGERGRENKKESSRDGLLSSTQENDLFTTEIRAKKKHCGKGGNSLEGKRSGPWSGGRIPLSIRRKESPRGGKRERGEAVRRGGWGRNSDFLLSF